MPVNQKKKILDQNFKGTSIKSGTGTGRGTGTKTNLESSCVYLRHRLQLNLVVQHRYLLQSEEGHPPELQADGEQVLFYVGIELP